MNDTIVIGLEWQDKIIDLKIPTEVTVDRLKVLLRDALLTVGLTLPEEFELFVKNKPLVLVPDVLLSHYPLGNGDQFLVKTVDNGGMKA